MAYQAFHDITCYTASPTPSPCPSTHCKLSCLAGKEDFILVPSSAWNAFSFSICILFFVLHNRTQLLSVFPLCVILYKTATLQLSLFCPLSYSSQHSLPPDCMCHAFHTMWMQMTQMTYFLLYIVQVSSSHTSMCIHMTFILTLVHMWVLWVCVVFPVRTGTLPIVFMLASLWFRVSIILRMTDVPFPLLYKQHCLSVFIEWINIFLKSWCIDLQYSFMLSDF